MNIATKKPTVLYTLWVLAKEIGGYHISYILHVFRNNWKMNDDLRREVQTIVNEQLGRQGRATNII